MYQTLGNGRTKLKLDDITTLIYRVTSFEPGFFIVIDAVDECGPYRKSVLQLLRKISNSPTRLLILGRSYVTEINSISNSIFWLEIKTPISDLRSFTEGRIASSELSELIPDEAKEDILRQIADQSSGIFLVRII